MALFEIKHWNGNVIVKEAWSLTRRGYTEGRIWFSDGTIRRYGQHRLVMELAIGRALLATEDVHHVDGNKSNNHIANLLLVDHSEHAKLTNSRRQYKRGYLLKPRAEVVAGIGACAAEKSAQ